jgi:SAM-dependent methyltransferase
VTAEPARSDVLVDDVLVDDVLVDDVLVDDAEVQHELPADVLFERALAGLPCWVHDATGRRTELPVDRWLGGASSSDLDRAVDAAMLRHCAGPTMDLGCGSGRLTAALAVRGVSALGVDSSALAVRMTVARGGLALQRDLFAPLPGLGRWAHVLLADGNIGIGGDPLRVLRRAAELLAPDGVVVVELEATGPTLVQRLRLETEDGSGHWFRWARVGLDGIGALAAAAGLVLLEATVVHEQAVAVLGVRRDEERSSA